jgi:hypothetical protein
MLKVDGTFALQTLRQHAGVWERSEFYRGDYKFSGKTMTLSRPVEGPNMDLSYGITRFVVVDATISSFSIQNDSATPLRFTLLPTSSVANTSIENISRRQNQ